MGSGRTSSYHGGSRPGVKLHHRGLPRPQPPPHVVYVRDSSIDVVRNHAAWLGDECAAAHGDVGEHNSHSASLTVCVLLTITEHGDART